MESREEEATNRFLDALNAKNNQTHEQKTRSLLESIARSLHVHPDCQPNSEFVDLVSSIQELLAASPWISVEDTTPSKPAREMNYQEIQSKYPKAVALWQRWALNNGAVPPIRLQDLNCERSLFDFFDQQGIVAGIGGCPVEGFSWWIYGGSSKKHPIAHDFGPNPTRQEAESAAFTKAFELLEEKL